MLWRFTGWQNGRDIFALFWPHSRQWKIGLLQSDPLKIITADAPWWDNYRSHQGILVVHHYHHHYHHHQQQQPSPIHSTLVKHLRMTWILLCSISDHFNLGSNWIKSHLRRAFTTPVQCLRKKHFLIFHTRSYSIWDDWHVAHKCKSEVNHFTTTSKLKWAFGCSIHSTAHSQRNFNNIR